METILETYIQHHYVGPSGNKSFYNDHNGELQYDTDNALILDENNAIPVLEVDNKYQLDDSCSINITLSGDIKQTGDSNNNYMASIVSLSDQENQFILSMGVCRGYLRVYSYIDNIKNPPSSFENECVEKGFANIDINEYAGQVLNIQLVSERNKMTKVYINGKLILNFESGSEKFTYKNVTIGDLRVGRNLKFKGKIYNFAIYGVALSEEEVQQNYEESKSYGVN